MLDLENISNLEYENIEDIYMANSILLVYSII